MAARPLSVNPLARGDDAAHLDEVTEKDREREERLARALRENLRRRKAHRASGGADDRNPPDEGATDD